ncbi:MAG TPA: metal-dependent hydrolase [Burkholderiaceae bacterium]|nr:metal-dependent hydrolase [Burkholderiaceae bacterium]
MDSLTQAVLGAGIQGAMLGRYDGRKALLAGALLATLPDLDVLIDYGDPVSAMIHHRGFSHSVFVLTAVAAMLATVWHRWRPSTHYGGVRLFITLWLVLVTHPLLDAFTSYGTQLWWPLAVTPTSWSSIFIIDPFFTVPLLIAVMAAAVAGPGPRMHRALCWCLAWAAAYLALSLVAKSVIEARVHRQLVAAGQRPIAMFSTPEPFNILLWRVVARTPDDHYIEAISSVLDRGDAEHIKLPLNTELADTLGDMPLLQGLRWFTDDWLRYDRVGNQLIVSDLRMGLGTGYYSFRFVMAKRQPAQDGWRAVPPAYWPRDQGIPQLAATLKRVWQAEPPLPLAQWETRMTAMPGSCPGPDQACN